MVVLPILQRINDWVLDVNYAIIMDFITDNRLVFLIDTLRA